MPKIATLDQLKDFANKVREAGGGNPLDALMPAVPSDIDQCLIAKNLNFNCKVNTDGPHEDWIMVLEDKTIRDNIAKALKLKVYDIPCDDEEDELFREYAVILPVAIGRVAAEFDEVFAAISGQGSHAWVDKSDRKALNRLKRFWPYLEASVKEAYTNASFVNARGELVL